MARAPMRSSVRSRDSSSASTGADPRERVKDCCRKLVAFMCTQVGVGGLVVGYAIVGAFGFQMIEMQPDSPYAKLHQHLNSRRDFYAEELWEKTAGDSRINVLDKKAFENVTDKVLQRFQAELVVSVKKGYNGLNLEEIWSFPAALMFSLSIITMIGYGNMIPRTPWGKGASVMYAVFGIPLYVLYFLNMGKVLAQTFKWLYRWFHECSGQKKYGQRITVPSTACLWVLFGYILVGAIMFAEWEGWDYLDSAYFCVTSLCKIGIGDFVPGANIVEAKSGSQTKLVINFIYLLLGMGLIAMCYNLMREVVRIKARELREDFVRAFDDFRTWMMVCCRMRSEEDF